MNGNIEVKLNWPDFVPAINDDGELWYICTIEGVDLKYTFKEGECIIVSDDEELLRGIEGDLKDLGKIEQGD